MSRFNSHKIYSYVNMIQDHKEKLQKAIILTLTIAKSISRDRYLDIVERDDILSGA